MSALPPRNDAFRSYAVGLGRRYSFGPDDFQHLQALAEGAIVLLDALERVAEQQPDTLRTLEKHGVVFDGPLGADPKNFQHVAFSIYTDLCEVDSIARAALAEVNDRG